MGFVHRTSSVLVPRKFLVESLKITLSRDVALRISDFAAIDAKKQIEKSGSTNAVSADILRLR
jgi:hypothetical protein